MSMPDYGPTILRDVLRMISGKQLGRGVARDVYACELVPDCVVKVEDNAGSFQNVMEWETWQRVKDSPVAKWFAPCRWISPSGTVLVMERTEPIPRAKFPTKVPAFLTDLKRTNYGLLKGRVVCHDYGTNLLIELGMTTRMRKADWWDLS